MSHFVDSRIAKNDIQSLVWEIISLSGRNTAATKMGHLVDSHMIEQSLTVVGVIVQGGCGIVLTHTFSFHSSNHPFVEPYYIHFPTEPMYEVAKFLKTAVYAAFVRWTLVQPSQLMVTFQGVFEIVTPLSLMLKASQVEKTHQTLYCLSLPPLSVQG